jgi:cytochrome b
MNRILVWDFPTRLFHWLLAVTFTASLGVGLFVSDENPLFAVHGLLGLVVGLIVLFRIFWGLAGSKYARFGSSFFSPIELYSYVKDALGGKTTRYVGHNPGSGYAVFVMLFLLAGLVATGLLCQLGGEGFEEVHEFFAYAMLAVVSVHIAGVIVHTAKHKENIAFSMVSGYKDGKANEGIPTARPLAGMVFLLLTCCWTAGLFSNFDQQTRQTTLPFIGTTIQLVEVEDKNKERRGGEHGHHEKDDD